jgi:hypothetical protein
MEKKKIDKYIKKYLSIVGIIICLNIINNILMVTIDSGYLVKEMIYIMLLVCLPLVIFIIIMFFKILYFLLKMEIKNN